MKHRHIPSRIFLRTLAILVFAVPAVASADVLDTVGASVGIKLAGFGASIFGLVGALFDKAISWLVFEIGSHMAGSIGVAVNLVWSIVRDICNMIFIFMFLFVGIRLVLTMESVANARKIIVRVVIAALLINFSLFIAKAIIDISNVTTVAVYNMFSPPDGSGYTFSVGTRIAGQLGIDTWFSSATTDQLANIPNKGFVAGLIMMFFFLLAAVTFLVATVMLIKRYIVLLIGMMFSPIVLLFSIIPKGIPFTDSFAKKADAGFQTFIQSAFFPAVFLFIIYITTVILGSFSISPNFAGMLGATSSSLPDIIVYCVGIGFLFLAMKTSSMVSDSLASSAMDMSRKVAGAATFGAAAYVGRQGLGRLAKAAGEGAVGNAIRSSKINQYKVGRALTTSALKGLDAARKGSYEIRGTKLYKEQVAGSDLGRAIGIQAGAGIGVEGGGFEERREAREAAEKKLAKEQAEILVNPGVVAERAELLEKAEKAVQDHAKKIEAARREYRDAQEIHGKDSPEARSARNAWNELRAKSKELDAAANTAKSALKEAESAPLLGTKDAQATIKRADTAAQYQAADARLGEVLLARERLAVRYANAKPEERVALQQRMSALESEAAELQGVIKKAKSAAGEIAKAPQQRAVAAAEARVAGAQAALAGLPENADAQVRKKLEEELLAAKKAKESAEVVAKAGPSIEDVAVALRNARKIARTTRATQGGIAGSLETGVVNSAREVIGGAMAGALNPSSKLGQALGVNKLPADIASAVRGAVEDVRTSPEKAAGESLRSGK